MKNKFYTVLLLVMFILGITIFVFPQTKSSIFERRILTKNEDIRIENISNKANDVLNDQFPLRNECIKTVLTKNSVIRNTFAGNTLLKVHNDLIHLSNGYYIGNYYKIYEDDKHIALNRAYNIQELSNKYPNINVYVYFPTKIEETTLLDNESVVSVYPNLKEDFIEQLGNKVKTSSLKLDTVEDYYKYFYKTDLHWNGYGVYEGYKDIVNMISEDYDIGEIKEANFIKYPYEFYGSYATKLGFICEPDYLIDMDVKTDEYKYFVNNKQRNDNEGIELYKKNGNLEKLYSDYEYVYGSNDYMRTYDFNQEDRPNILIFSDSYVNPLKKSLASHFNKTVIIDLRANDGSFNLDDLIQEYNINIVLFLQAYEDLYFNGYLFVPLN